MTFINESQIASELGGRGGPSEPPDEQREPSVFDRCGLRLDSQPAWLVDEPPRQDWLLTRYEHRRDIGVLPRGKTGLLNATGGVGKTYALIQLALAVARGDFWLSTFKAAPGHVCLALGEEDADEIRRRLWRACNALELSLDERADAAQRIHVLPLAGEHVALTGSLGPGFVAETASAGELRAWLASRDVEWSLIVLDPLSRWAGGGVEGDNEAATRFCQTIETLTRAPGNPSVLVAHHSSKTSATAGSADARGVTGIRDGFRWQATLDAVSADGGLRGAILRNRKSNYSLEFDDIALVRNQEPGCEGTLRLAEPSEQQALGLVAEQPDELAERVVATIRANPGMTSASQVAEEVGARKASVLAAIRKLTHSGRILKSKRGFEVVPTPEPDNGASDE